MLSCLRSTKLLSAFETFKDNNKHIVIELIMLRKECDCKASVPIINTWVYWCVCNECY